MWSCSMLLMFMLGHFATSDLICHRTDQAPTKVTDEWCTEMCNYVPPNCPSAYCECHTPPPSPPVPPPPPMPAGPFGQQFMAYYSGEGIDTIKGSGVNALSLAFFDPAQSSWDYSRLLGDVKNHLSELSQNTSPHPGAKPVVMISFGGQSMGGGSWESVFGADGAAAAFGERAADLAAEVATQIDAHVGIDLDVEGARELRSFGAFIKAFRAKAPFDKVPLMLCSFSGLADPANAEHYKVDLMKKYGPEQQGINWLNFMVDNVAASCMKMEGYWLDERLAFLPNNARLFGMWGVNLAAWMLKDPGCTDGPQPLFSWMRSQNAGVAIWELWQGDASPIRNIVDQIRSGHSEDLEDLI